MKKLLSICMLLVAVSFGSIVAMAQTNNSLNPPPPAVPSAKKVARSTTFHGDTLADDYFWLREKKNPEVISYLEAENAYTDAWMKPTEGFQAALYKEMLSHIKETDTNVPYREGGYLYYTRTEQGKQYPIYARKRGGANAPEEITLELNEMAKGLKFMSVNSYDVSADARMLAYSTDTTGFREYTLYVKDLGTGQAS